MGTRSWMSRALFALGVTCLAFVGGLPLASPTEAQVAGSGSIGGTVTDDSGAPLAGVEVGAQGYWDGWYETVTDGDGRYEFTGLPDEDYAISFTDPSGTHAREYYDSTTDWNAVTWLEVSDGATITGIDATLEPGGRITGSVLDEAGNPFARTSVCVVGTTNRCEDGAADGTFEVGGLAAGDYYVAVETWEADGTARSQWYDGVHGPIGATLVPVAPGQASGGVDFVFDLTLYGTLSGQVHDQDGNPFDEGYVCAEGEISECDDLAADGTYSLGLLPGDYRVSFSVEQGDLRHYYDGTPGGTDDYDQALRIPVAAGSAITGIDGVFDLSSYGAISGTVLDADGQVVSGSWVCLMGGPTWRCADVEADGTYYLRLLEPGDYIVQFSIADSSGEGIVEYWEGADGIDTATPVAVQAGQTVVGINSSGSSGQPGEGWISGTVTFASGDPVTFGEVCAVPQGALDPSDCVDVDVDGSYHLGPLVPDVYRIGALFEFDDAPASPMYDGEVVIPWAGATAQGIDIEFSPEGSISGVVTGPGGSPATGVLVGLFGPDDVWWPSYLVETGSDGGYRVDEVARGEYRVMYAPLSGSGLARTWLTDEDGTTAMVEVLHGAHSTISPELVSVGSVAGSVSDPDGTPVTGVEVQLRAVGSPWVTGTTTTGADGSYAFDSVQPDDYRLRFVAPEGSGFADVWFDGVDGRTEAEVITVASGGAVAADGTLQWERSVSGTVTGPGAAPVEGAVVRAYRDSDGIVPSVRTETSTDGTYSFSNLPRGAYRVQVTPPGGSGLLTGWFDGSSRGTARLIVVDDLDHLVVDVELAGS